MFFLGVTSDGYCLPYKINARSLLVFDSEDECKQNFYEEMTALFNNYEKGFAPNGVEDVSISDVFIDAYYNVVYGNLHVISIKTIWDTFIKSEFKPNAKIISYGVSGGLNLGFSAVIVAV